MASALFFLDLKGKVKDDTQLKTVHQNTITMIRPYESSGAGVSKFSCRSHAFSYVLSSRLEEEMFRKLTRKSLCSEWG